MRYSQRGVTFIGWVILLIPVAIVVYAGIRLTPVYLNYMRVAQALTQLATEHQGGVTLDPQQLRVSLEKRFDIDSIENPDVKSVDIHREGDHFVAISDYEDTIPMFGNISLLVQFHKRVDMQ
jgi:hypothetical protein